MPHRFNDGLGSGPIQFSTKVGHVGFDHVGVMLPIIVIQMLEQPWFIFDKKHPHNGDFRCSTLSLAEVRAAGMSSAWFQLRQIA